MTQVTTDRKKSVFVLGDSISVQYGEFLKPMLAERFEYRVKETDGDAYADLDIPQGTSGGDSRMVLDYLSKAKPQGKLQADLALINFGLHDIKTKPGQKETQISIAQYEKNLLQLIAIYREIKVPLAWVTTTLSIDAIHNTRSKGFHRSAKDNQTYHQLAVKLMREHGLPIIDLRHYTARLGGEEIFRDHVHYPPEVCKQQACYLAGWISAWFELRGQ